MKKLLKTRSLFAGVLTSISLAMFLTGCIIVTDYGPNGNNGKVYFGIDYDYNAPYSYWDNNPSTPNAPFFGEYYRSYAGTFQFEYFVNQYEYWYGTYQLRINPGQAGQPYGEPGRDGIDNYLLMICNDDGFYFESWNECNCGYRSEIDGVLTYDIETDKANYRIEMRKTTIQERKPQAIPKYQLNK